jgi:hypothetical protein
MNVPFWPGLMTLNVTVALPKLLTSLPSGPNLDEVRNEPSFRKFPKTEMIEPGATGAGCKAKLAPFTIPPSKITGGGP